MKFPRKMVDFSLQVIPCNGFANVTTKGSQVLVNPKIPRPEQGLSCLVL